VVSGINFGANMGDDTIYSGTVAAATEGFLFGLPSIAVVPRQQGGRHFDTAAAVAGSAGAALRRSPIDQPVLLQRQRARHRARELGALEVTRLGRRHKSEPVVKMQTPRGEAFWIGAGGGRAGCRTRHGFPRRRLGQRLDHAAAGRPHFPSQLPLVKKWLAS
jgi:5'-nucleotidase